jgi:hypothetical protein
MLKKWHSNDSTTTGGHFISDLTEDTADHRNVIALI